MNILVAKNGSQLGPFSEADIHAKLASGELASTDLGWKEGMATWSPLSTMFAAAPLAPPPQGQNAPGSYAPQPQSYAPQGQQQSYSPQPSQVPQPYNAPQGQYSAPQTYNSPYPAQYQQGAVQQWGAPGGVVYAGFWLRVLAIIIDTIVINIVMYIVGFILGLVLGATHLASQSALVAIVYILALAVNWAYYAGMESSASQATLGKQAVGLKVTDMNGSRIGFGLATGRYFGKILSALLLGVGLIMAGFTERKQALHDLMAGTLVVRK